MLESWQLESVIGRDDVHAATHGRIDRLQEVDRGQSINFIAELHGREIRDAATSILEVEAALLVACPGC